MSCGMCRLRRAQSSREKTKACAAAASGAPTATGAVDQMWTWPSDAAIPPKDTANELRLPCRKCGEHAGEPTGAFEKNSFRTDRGFFDVYGVRCEKCGHAWWSQSVVPPSFQ